MLIITGVVLRVAARTVERDSLLASHWKGRGDPARRDSGYSDAQRDNNL
jgi:hypothetical protein